MAKKVRYNGGRESYLGCSNPTNLVVGKEYEVTRVRQGSWWTVYTLKGIYGEFNSAWFDEVSEDQVYMAIARVVPELGESCSCYKMEFIDHKPVLVPWITSTVREISYMGKDIYRVTTRNSVYIVNVGY